MFLLSFSNTWSELENCSVFKTQSECSGEVNF
jgi:hypothetical protein